jgi:hypothetical protein
MVTALLRIRQGKRKARQAMTAERTINQSIDRPSDGYANFLAAEEA